MQLTLSERTSLARLAVDRARRTALARVLGSPLMRWRYGAPVAEELVIVPQDIRTADPSVARELERGYLGLAGQVAHLDGRSPFDVEAPSAAWLSELHGFSWLRHLAADEGTRRLAVSLVSAWIKRGHATEAAWEPQVLARRLISWLSHAPMLLDEADPRRYDRIMESLARQLVRLSTSWRDARCGPPRLLALMALIYGDLCVAGRESYLEENEAALAAELAAQILPDGGHVSRNAGVLVELLLDLLPLRQCFLARGREVPTAIDAASRRMMSMLHFMRLGDGSLGRFNGMSALAGEALATILAYGPEAPAEHEAPQSAYVRLERGEVVVLADAGPPPPLEYAGEAHAGCLSFEMSAGPDALFVNRGAPGLAEQGWRAASRATASHNTACVGAKSSSRLVRHGLLERLIGAAPIRLPERVTSTLERTPQGDALTMSHDGYLAAFGLIHRRHLMLAADGGVLEGHDSLGPPSGTLRLKQDIPFSIHFHLAPEARCAWGAGESRAEIALPGGGRWRLSAEGAALSLEESVHFADRAGPRQALQIVLRGACCGESLVLWRVERVG
ncbi:MAG TPA: heparinase II/III family protein [Hyphomicrobiaceae bacterium]|nr:heparinase II/III family protein [Hyphomicrobiaceae bacterium]